MSKILLVILIIVALTQDPLPEPVYTIHYVQSFRPDLIEKNFGCGKAVVYGTYIYPQGAVDALHMILNSQTYGFNALCNRKQTYLKLFGSAQNYQTLLKAPFNTIVDQLSALFPRSSVKKIIVEWRYRPQLNGGDSSRWLEGFLGLLKDRGYTAYLKAPASLFCLYVNNRKYLIDQPVENFILQLYGEQTGAYTTYQSIFGQQNQSSQPNYPESGCYKFPSLAKLKKQYPSKNFHPEKTYEPEESGYIGPLFQTFLSRGRSLWSGLYFYDGYPDQLSI